jgi:hypothetical protein
LFHRIYTLGSWNLMRGTDYFNGEERWLLYNKNITQEQYDAMTPQQQQALMAEYAVYENLWATGHQMSGSIVVTYEYAAEGDLDGHTWKNGRNSYNILKGDRTPPDSPYHPYHRRSMPTSLNGL